MADCKRKTANLFDSTIYELVPVSTTALRKGTNLGILPQGRYTLNAVTSSPLPIYRTIKNGDTYTYETIETLPYTFTTDGISEQIIRTAGQSGDSWADVGYTNLMLNTGSTALPYEPYGWVHSLRKLGTDTDTITTLPADIYADGTAATIGLKGNTVQNGTPTPQNPVDVVGVGERTANFFDGSIEQGSLNETSGIGTDYNNTKTSSTAVIKPYRVRTANPIYIDRELTLSVDFNSYLMYVLYYDENQQYTGEHSSSWRNSPLTLSGEYIGKYIGLAFKNKASGNVPISPTDDIKFMLNEGSTALPYEPNGIKIPISSAYTTTNNYLGEVQTERRIKKLVLDGTETLYEGASNYYILINVSGRGDGIPNSTALSTHTESGVVVNGNGTALFFKKSIFVHSSLADFKTYIQQQYANGTPVTVWYVLATPQTAIVNEPLQKIGDYADSISGISIPTTDGANALSIGTTVQPSEVTAAYHGWHTGTVHERESGQWDE